MEDTESVRYLRKGLEYTPEKVVSLVRETLVIYMEKNLDPYLLTCIKVKSKWMNDLDTKTETMSL